MSTFSVKVAKILSIDRHPNADAIEIATVFGYKSIVKKNEYQKGELVVYIPEASLLPEFLLKKMNFWDYQNNKGTLSTAKGNKVKIVKLRGEVSQGIILKLEKNPLVTTEYAVETESGFLVPVIEDTEVADFLGIEKYNPEIPQHLRGDMAYVGDRMPKYDVENYQNYPDWIADGTPVEITEKCHGTCSVIAHIPGLNHDEVFDKDWVISSKGLGSKGFAYKDSKHNQDNLYVNNFKRLREQGFCERLLKFREENTLGITLTTPIIIYGEIFGPGVQDLHYGQKTFIYRAFDVIIGEKALGRYLNVEEKTEFFKYLKIDKVPHLYKGPWSPEIGLKFRDGNTTFNAKQIREGIVITPLDEIDHPRYGRIFLKWVSPDYLLRKGNATEYQ